MQATGVLRAAIAAVDPELVLYAVRSMDERVDRALVEAPDARADLRVRAPGRKREKLAGRIEHAHRFARPGRTVDARHRAGEDPGMAPLERFLATARERDGLHLRRARGCAAS